MRTESGGISSSVRFAQERANLGINRRSLFKAGIAGVASLAGSAPLVAKVKRAPRRTYLLVHGSWHGGWCWDEVSQRLATHGHRLYAPTLTGLGERVHLISRAISLETHIADVLNVIRFEDLRDIVIVAHSYSGVVVTGVCDRARDRIAHVVYIDALSPQNGEWNALSMSQEDVARAFGPIIDGYLIAPPDPSVLGVPANDTVNRALLKSRMTPHPLRTWFDPIKLVSGGSDGLPRTFVFCNNAPKGSPIAALALRRKHDPAWRYREIDCGHDAMLLRPADTAAVLQSVVL